MEIQWTKSYQSSCYNGFGQENKIKEMFSITLQFTIKGQQLYGTVPHIMVADTINYFEAKFHFSEPCWDGLSKWVHFKQGEKIFDFLLDEDDHIKAEYGLNLSAGQWQVYLHGTESRDGETVTRIITNAVELKVQPSECLEGIPLPPTPPSATEQIEALAQEAKDIAQSVRKDADDGVFRGEKGEKGDDGLLQVVDEIPTKDSPYSGFKVEKLLDQRIKKFYTNNLGETHLTDSDKGMMRNIVLRGKSVQDVVPTPNDLQEIKSVDNVGIRTTGSAPDIMETVRVPHILRGIRDNNIGDYKDRNGQQWVCDEVDTERGVLVQRIKTHKFTGTEKWSVAGTTFENCVAFNTYIFSDKYQENKWTAVLCNAVPTMTGVQYSTTDMNGVGGYDKTLTVKILKTELTTSEETNAAYLEAWTEYLAEKYKAGTPIEVQYSLYHPQEIKLSEEELKTYEVLSTRYGITNIVFDSDNGVEPHINFDYPCAIEGLVEYIKEQIGDNRIFQYNMEQRLTDTEYLSALAYVNSEYAAALIELEV